MNSTRKITMKVILVVSFVCGCLSETSAARILGIFTMAGKSHFTCNHAIMKSLHDAGHHITMITPFPSEEKMENFTYVDSRFDSVIMVGFSTINNLTAMNLHDLMELLIDTEVQYCYNVMKLKEIQEVLNSPKKLYDVMFVEMIMGHECYLAIAERLGIPVIGTVTAHFHRAADITLGVPHSPAIMPSVMALTGLEMTFFERLRNLWNSFISDYYVKIIMPQTMKRFYRDHFGKEEVHKKDISLMFYNNHPTFLPRPMTPNAIEVGGIHLKPPKPLPEKFQNFIDEASHGVVLFTFGSVVKASTLSMKQKEAFLAAFATIPQRVIWKFEEPIDNLPQNIMLSNWLPQRDILEHKKVIAFISHCGQSGTYEAVMTGTPVVAIPLFGDQPINAVNLKRRGVAVGLDLETVTKENVLDALNKIINDTSYYQKMQALSRAFKDRPMSPQNSVVYWTEYVIRHDGAQYLKSLGTDMPLYKYFMLDILALVLIIASLITYMVHRAVKKLYCIQGNKRLFIARVAAFTTLYTIK